MVGDRAIERGTEIVRAADHLARLPVGVVGIALPSRLMAVEEQAGPRPLEEFIDLAADIAEIDVRRGRIGHVGGGAAAEIDMDVGRRQHLFVDNSRTIDAQLVDREHKSTVEQHHMRREDQVVAIVMEEMLQHRAPVAIPGRQVRRRMWIVEHRRLAIGLERQAHGFGRQQIEFGITDRRKPVRREPGLADQTLADLGPRDEHMIEARARLVETDRAIARTMAGMDDPQAVETIARLQEQRGLLGDHQRVERSEEIEIVPIDGQLGRRQQRFQIARSKTRQRMAQRELHDRQRRSCRNAQPLHLLGQARVARRDDDFGSRRLPGRRQRDRQ